MQCNNLYVKQDLFWIKKELCLKTCFKKKKCDANENADTNVAVRVTIIQASHRLKGQIHSLTLPKKYARNISSYLLTQLDYENVFFRRSQILNPQPLVYITDA